MLSRNLMSSECWTGLFFVKRWRMLLQKAVRALLRNIVMLRNCFVAFNDHHGLLCGIVHSCAG